MRQGIVLLLLAASAAVALGGCGASDSHPPGVLVTGRANTPAEVRVYPQGHGGEAEYLITSVHTRSCGYFELCVPQEAVYDIDVGYMSATAGGLVWLNTLLRNVSVVGPVTDLGMVSVPDPTP